MESNRLNDFLERHCRFRFRGGKEAFGVIWVEPDGHMIFSSKESHERYRRSEVTREKLDALEINSEDVLLAEPIA